MLRMVLAVDMESEILLSLLCAIISCELADDITTCKHTSLNWCPICLHVVKFTNKGYPDWFVQTLLRVWESDVF
jgi:hypothetical protein